MSHSNERNPSTSRYKNKKTAAGEMIKHDITGKFDHKKALVDFSMHPVYENNKIVRLIAEGRLKEKPH